MSKLPEHVLLERAARWLAEQDFEVDKDLAVDDRRPVRLKDPGYGEGRPVCVWVSSDPPKVSFFNHHGGTSGYSYLDTSDEWRSQTPEERRKAEAERMKRMDARKAAELKGYERTAKKAQAVLSKATDAPADFPYFVRKAVAPCRGLKFGEAWYPERKHADGRTVPGHVEKAVLVPLSDLNGRVWSYQAIFADGFKAHLSGGKARGSFFEIPADDGCEKAPTAFLEGLATGLTVHELTGARCIVCCDCGNLLPVASDFVGHGMLGSCVFDEEGQPTGRSGGVPVQESPGTPVLKRSRKRPASSDCGGMSRPSRAR